MKREKTKVIVHGAVYFIYRPERCQGCRWKSGKHVCSKKGKPCADLLREIDSCKKCAQCSYSHEHPCASGACYKDLMMEMIQKRGVNT